MKSTRKNPFLRALPHHALTAFLIVSPLSAGTVYWDTNSTTTGSGNADGTWDAVTTNWGNAAGTGTTSAWVAGDIAAFAAGTDFTGTRTVTVSGTQSLGGILVESEVVSLTLNGGTLDFGSLQGSINTSAWGTANGRTFNVNSVIAGTNGLTIASNGDLSAAGGGNSSITRLGGTNTFTGDVTITSGLVAYGSNAAFGNSTNKIILNGGGLLDANTSTALSRDIQVLAGGGTFRTWGSTNVIWSGAITGSGTINRTDGGTITHSGDLSGFSGTYNVQAGSTVLTGTAGSIGGNWSVATGLNLTVNSTASQTLNGSVSGAGNLNINSSSALTIGGVVSVTGNVTVNGLATFGAGSSLSMGTGNLNINGTGVATFGSGSTVNVDNINLTGATSNQLNIQAGATVTTRYLNIGNSANNSGRVVQTGGNVTIAAGGNGMRIGHWNNGSNAGSLYNLSGGTLDASAITSNIGWDGQGDMIVGGGAGSALFRAGGIQLDGSGNGGGNGLGDMTLTVSSNGTVEVGASGIGAAAAGDRVILNGGTMTAVANSTWGSVFNANSSTSSVLNTNGFTVTLSNNITGTGTVNLSSSTGGVTLNTAGTQTISASLVGSTAINKTGTGTTTLSGAGSYSGAITVTDGRLNLDGSVASNISVLSSRSFGGEGSTTGSLSFAGSNSLFVSPSTPGELTVGNLTLSGTNTLRFDSAPVAGAGAFEVLTYTGTLTGSFGTNLVVENAARYRGTTFTDTAGVVTLDLNTAALTWNGTSGGQWDTLGSSRWNTGETHQFAWGDSVTFDDSGVATTITLSGEVQPSSITVTGSKNYTINGSAGNFISGFGSLVKSGSSTLILNAPNTFSGATSVTGGTLQIGDGTNNFATLGTSAANVGSGATLAFFRNGLGISIANTLSGSGTVAFLGTGVSTQSDYNLTGTNTGFSGTFDVRSGARLQVDSANDTGTSSIVINNGGQLYLLGGTLSNSITIDGNGWNETGGPYGAIRFTGGTLSGAITLAGNSRLNALGSNETGTISGSISGGFGISKTGAGVVILSGTNTYTGDTTVSAGLLRLNSATAIPGGLAATGGTGNISLNGGVLGLGNAGLNRGLGAGATQIQLAGASGFAAFGASRTVNFGGAGASVTWGSGGFAPTTLVLGHSSADSSLIISNAIDLGASARTVQVDNGTAAIDGQFSGVLSGTGGSLVKTGTGTLALSAINTFTGGTTINAGMIDLTGGGGATGTLRGTVTVNTSATLQLTAGDATGFAGGSSAITTINLTGGALNLANTNNQTLGSAAIIMTGGSITGVANSNLDFFGGASSLTTLASASSSTIAGAKINLRQNNGLTLTVADGTAANDLVISSVISSTNGFTNNNLTKAGAGNLVLSGTNTFTTATNITGGTLTLDYATNNTTKLADASALTFGNGATTLALSGGSHTEIVASTTLAAGAAANITRSSGTSVIQLGTITRGAGATLNLSAAGIATTSTTNTNGIIGTWATVGGNWATNSTNAANGSIVAFTAYTDVTRLSSGTKALADATANNVRIIDGTGTAANLTLAAATTNINTLNQTATGGSTSIDLSTNTLRLGTASGILMGSGTSALTIGTAVNQGTLTAGGNTVDVAGEIVLTNNSANTLTINSAIRNNGTGAVSLVKSGSGLVTLAGNTGNYSGGTTINSGELRVSTPTTAGTYTTLGTGAVTVNAGATLRFFTGSTSAAITFANAINLNNATLINDDGVHTLSGAVALTGANTINGVYAGKNLILSNVVSGSGSLTKIGAADLTLSGNNTYTGATTVTGGRLNLSGTNSSSISVTGATLGGIGSTTGGLTTNAGAILALTGSAPTSAFTASGSVNFAGATGISFDTAPTLALGTTTFTVVNYGSLSSGLTNLSGPSGYRTTLSDDTVNKRVLLNVTTGTRTWNQTTAGTWNTLTGTTFAEGDTRFATGDAVVFDDTATNGAVTLSGTLLPGSVTVNNSTTAYTFSGSGAIGGTTGLTKSNTGRLTISNANSYTGATAINGGVVNIQNASALGTNAAGTTVASGAALEIQGAITTTEALALSGTGISSGGALRNISGNNSVTGAITLGAATRINSDSGTLTLSSAISLGASNSLTVGGSGNTTLGGAITATGATLSKDGTGTLQMNAGGNTADIFINNGTLNARGGGFSTGFASGRTITVDGSGILDTTTHSMGSSVGGGGSVPTVILTNGGTWRANNEQYMQTLTMTGGNVTGAGEIRTLGSSVYTSNASSVSSTFSAGLALFNNASVVVNNGAAADDLIVSGLISSSGTMTKSGAGTMVISGASTNTFSNTFAINNGVVRVEKSSGLGTTAAGTSVASGAALQLANNIAIGAEALTLNGSGVSTTGALRNVSGNNSYAGAITLGSASRINSDSGTLTLSGAIGGAAQNLTIGGAGDTTLSNAIATTTGSLTKDGAGTLTLSGTSTYTGTTTVSAGTLLVNGALSGSSSTSVSSGATLGGTGSITNAVTVLNGGTLSPGASIESLGLGSLDLDGSLLIEWDTTVSPNIDFLNIVGALNLGSNSSITFSNLGSGSLDLNTPYVFASYGAGGLTGTFNTISNLPVGFTLDYNYGGLNQIAIVPEPSVAFIAFLGASLPLLRRRRRTSSMN